MKAGFYSEVGRNTCGSIYSGSTGGIGAGLFMHEKQDFDSIFKSWGYNFIKIDFCGGLEQGLDEKTAYTNIRNRFNQTGIPDINLNVCRWQFPGVWVTKIADSWRMSHDINVVPGSAPKWSTVLRNLDQNTYLAPYVS